MTDLSGTVAPKSDQLNADDLIAGSRTITITGVKGVSGDQPIAIYFDGDNGKPFKPCKSMRRVMIKAWGADGSQYAGKSMTLFCDPTVKFGGIAVGGIRISHMSHIDSDLSMPLTVTRAQRKQYNVKKLEVEQQQEQEFDSIAMLEEAGKAADLGLNAYKEWYDKQGREVRNALVDGGYHDDFKAEAEKILV